MNKRNMVIGIVGVMLLAGGWMLWGPKKVSGADIKTTTPFYGNMERSISATGIVQPQNRLEIKPPIPGRVDKILVEEGQRVKTGADALKEWEEIYKAAPLMAPIDGEVIVKAVNPGQTVTSADVVIVLSDRLIVQAQVDETDIGKVKVGQAAVISLDAYSDMEVQATVDHIYYESTTVNNVTIYQVDIVTQEIPTQFRSGMSANVRIVQEKKENVLVLPMEFVKQEQGKSFVLIGQGRGQAPVRAEIVTGLTDENNIEVIRGLKADDTVVLKTAVASGKGSKKAKPATSPFMPSRPGRGGR